MLTKFRRPVVRAIDVGFTNTKFTLAPATEDMDATYQHIPSVVTTPPAREIAASIGMQRNTFRTEINGVVYEVGPDVRYALAGNASGQTNDVLWFRNDHYRALIHGALHYMQAPEVIDLLVLGLPVSTYGPEHNAQLAEAYKGEHVIGVGKQARKIRIESVLVLPQPYGGFVSLIKGDEELLAQIEEPDSVALVIDPGWNTIDWFTVSGGSFPLDSRTNAAENAGMQRVLAAISDEISRTLQRDVGSLHRIDDALRLKRPLMLGADRVEIDERLLKIGDQQAFESVQRVMRGIGSTSDITHVGLVGGPVHMFSDPVKRVFSSYKVICADSPLKSLYAVVDGFQYLGQMRMS